MLFANFFDLFIPQHAAGLLLVFLAAFCRSLALSRGRIFSLVLLHLEDGATRSVLSEDVRAGVAALSKASCRSFVRFGLNELVPIR